jgi:sterol desaturase/sphingolipid hydroxylase (fatty acid hydroxylase superfamily)
MKTSELLFFFLPIFFFFIALEILYYRQDKRSFPWREAIVSLVMFAVYQLVNRSVVVFLKPVIGWVYDFRMWTAPMNQWWAWVLLFFAVEFCYYWMHRCTHEIRWLWASHSVHHSPTTITLSGAYRLAITSSISGLFLFFLPLYWLGFAPTAVGIMLGLNLAYQFWLHTETIPRLGLLEKWLNTPSNHRVHHSIEEQYIDKNYGGVLIVFDRLFGTYVAEDESLDKRYGLLGKTPSLNPVTLFFQEWVAMAKDLWQSRDIQRAFRVCFGRPGALDTPPERGFEPMAISRPAVGDREMSP